MLTRVEHLHTTKRRTSQQEKSRENLAINKGRDMERAEGEKKTGKLKSEGERV